MSHHFHNIRIFFIGVAKKGALHKIGIFWWDKKRREGKNKSSLNHRHRRKRSEGKSDRSGRFFRDLSRLAALAVFRDPSCNFELTFYEKKRVAFFSSFLWRLACMLMLLLFTLQFSSKKERNLTGKLAKIIRIEFKLNTRSSSKNQ